MIDLPSVDLVENINQNFRHPSRRLCQWHCYGSEASHDPTHDNATDEGAEMDTKNSG